MSNTTINGEEPAVGQCTHCHMFDHLVDECAMLTGEYEDGRYDGQGNGEYDYDDEYVDYYAEYDKYADQLADQWADQEEPGQEEPGQEEPGPSNELTEEEYAEWMRQQEEEDEYEEDHSPDADVRWAKQSSMAAFDHFQRTGAKLDNRDFVGNKSGAPLRSELGSDE